MHFLPIWRLKIDRPCDPPASCVKWLILRTGRSFFASLCADVRSLLTTLHSSVAWGRRALFFFLTNILALDAFFTAVNFTAVKKCVIML